MNDFVTLRAAALAALVEHRRVVKLVRGYTHLSPVHQANLIGRPPHWAHYVTTLGEPGPNFLVTGSAGELRARALRMLVIADKIEPIGQLG